MRTPRRHILALFTCFVAACAPRALAQSTPDDPVAADTPAALVHLINSYRAGPIAERVTIRCSDASGRTRESIVQLRLDRGDASAGRPASLRLDMGALTVFAQEHRLIGVHALNPDEFVEIGLETGLSPEVLTRVLPPVPLPQVGWALGDDAVAEDGRVKLWGIGAGSLRASSPPRFEGTLDAGGAIELLPHENARGLASLTATIGPAPRSVSLSLTAESAEPGDPATWAPPTQGRRALGSLAMLRARPGLVSPGSPLPAIGLMKDDLTGWSLTDTLRDLSQRAPQPAGFTVAALVFFDPADAASARAARSAHNAAARLTRSPAFSGARAGDPRVTALVVGTLDLKDVSPQGVAAARERWAALPGEPAHLLWTSTPRETLDRIAPGRRAFVLLADAHGRLAHVIALGGDETIDEDSIAAEISAAMTSAPAP